MISEFMMKVSDLFWCEKFWLPPEYGWHDVRKWSAEGHQYPDWRMPFREPILLGFVLVVVRKVLEKLVFRRVGVALGISDAQQKKAKECAVLEKHFDSVGRHVSSDECVKLAKQCDMSAIQVKKWFYTKRQQHKPSTLVKFEESAWRMVGYLGLSCIALWTLWDREWIRRPINTFENYPFHEVDRRIEILYMSELAFYISLVLTLFTDVRRKDFREMASHHCITITLLVFSWLNNFCRIGTWVIILHDPGDILLESAKLAVYAKRALLQDVIFVSFTVFWILTRLVGYYSIVLWTTMYNASNVISWFPCYFFFNTLLIALGALQLYWTGVILSIAKNAINAGPGNIEDVRSDEDSSDEIANGGENAAKKD